MVEQFFGALFILALTLPAVAVLAGVAILAWPSGQITRHHKTVHHVPARA